MPQINPNVSKETKDNLKEFLTENKTKYKSQNEFVENAINTLIEIENQNSNQFLNVALMSAVESIIGLSEERITNRFASLLFSQAISIDILMQLQLMSETITATEIEMMRHEAIGRVQQNKSMPDFRSLIKDVV